LMGTEYQEPYGEAFGEIRQEAAAFSENCNVILKYNDSLSWICLLIHISCTFSSFLRVVLRGNNG